MEKIKESKRKAVVRNYCFFSCFTFCILAILFIIARATGVMPLWIEAVCEIAGMAVCVTLLLTLMPILFINELMDSGKANKEKAEQAVKEQ